MATHWATGGTLGVTLESTNSSAAGAQHALGSTVVGNNASQWMYVFASAAISQYQAVAIEASGTASPASATNLRAGATPGIAQVAFDVHDYGWVALAGNNLRVMCNGAVAVSTRLYTTATAGNLDDAAASTQACISGLRVVVANVGSTASAVACVAQNMVIAEQAFVI